MLIQMQIINCRCTASRNSIIAILQFRWRINKTSKVQYRGLERESFDFINLQSIMKNAQERMVKKDVDEMKN